MAVKIAVERLKQLLHYDPETGIFTWRERSVDTFENSKYSAERKCSMWNLTFAGKTAGAWDGKGYLVIRVDFRLYAAHRLAWLYMTGFWPAQEIDHINCNSHDNRFANLREASRSENNTNKTKRTHNKSGLKGVSFEAYTGRWRAQITKDGRAINIGRFDTKEAAYAAYCEAARKYHGEYARVA